MSKENQFANEITSLTALNQNVETTQPETNTVVQEIQANTLSLTKYPFTVNDASGASKTKYMY